MVGFLHSDPERRLVGPIASAHTPLLFIRSLVETSWSSSWRLSRSRVPVCLLRTVMMICRGDPYPFFLTKVCGYELHPLKHDHLFLLGCVPCPRLFCPSREHTNNNKNTRAEQEHRIVHSQIASGFVAACFRERVQHWYTIPPFPIIPNLHFSERGSRQGCFVCPSLGPKDACMFVLFCRVLLIPCLAVQPIITTPSRLLSRLC